MSLRQEHLSTFSIEFKTIHFGALVLHMVAVYQKGARAANHKAQRSRSWAPAMFPSQTVEVGSSFRHPLRGQPEGGK